MEFDISITKDLLFSKISQEEIFERILGIKIVYNKKIINPLRKDLRPTVTFKWFGDTLVMADYSGWFTGNCIQLVMKINYCNYQQALKFIYDDFSLATLERTPKVYPKPEAESTLFKVYTEPLSDSNMAWWNSFKITERILTHYEVSKIREAHIKKYSYYYFDSDPGYHYTVRNLEGEPKSKLYFPNRTEYRFFSNIPKDSWNVQGLFQLKNEAKDYLIITKSLKDVMALYRFDVPAISLNSESTLLHEPVLEYLSNRYNKIYINMDYDYAGIRMMNIYKKRGFPVLFFDKSFYPVKDFADYCKLTDELTIKNFLNKIKNENY